MWALVNAVITIIVDGVALLHCARINLRIIFVAVQAATRAVTFAVLVPILVHALAHAHGHARPISTLAVIVFSIAANFSTSGVHTRVIIIAIRAEATPTRAIPISVPILAITRNHQIGAIAILIDSIVGDVSCTGIDCGVSVITVEAEASLPLAKTIAVGIDVTAHWADRVGTAAILVSVVATHICRPWVRVWILVIAVGTVATAADSKPIDVIVCTVHEARRIASATVIVFAITASFCLPRIYTWVLVVAIPSSSAITIASSRTVAVVILIWTLI